ncbi:MAG: ATP-binding protein [Ardenticatenaceae bacterium]|nr:ATP-binding protein [Ardenticatenaceae bacterium]
MSLQEISDETIVNQFPMPIAHEYQELLKTSPANWVAKATQLSRVFEFSLRYCTVIILSQYYVERYKDNPAPNEIDLFIAKNIASPTIKVCIDILRQISRSYLRPHLAFMPELIAFSVTPDGGVADGLFLATELNSFIDQLNNTPVSNEYRYKALFEENIGKVKKFLQHLGFLQKYILVRLVSREVKAPVWIVNSLIGCDFNFDESSQKEVANIHATDELTPNMLAIYSKKSQHLLHLSRYTIFVHCPTCYDEQRQITNRFFVYERTLAQKDIYVGLEDTLGQPHRVPLDTVVEDLWKSKLLAEAEITHSLLAIQTRMRVRTQDQLYSLRKKYDAALYVPREETQAEVESFLASDKTGFLIVGDSGVGKTNLLCDLAATILENGAIVSFEVCSAFDSQVINDGFDQFLSKRYGFNLDVGFLGTLNNLAKDLSKKIQFVLFLDAINEFEDPVSLLESLYTWLIVPTEHSAWFKIIISCRSESWIRLEGGFKGERHFWEKDGTIVHRLARFSDSELSEAYKVYQEKYQIRSSFSELSTQAINFITLPLMLRLVAESNFGSKIPPSLKTYEVFQRYVELKMNTQDQVTASDENLIVNQLVKKMYETRTDRLALASLFTDTAIGQLVMEQRPGRPWVNLIDKGILMAVGGTDDTYYVRFAYDQILEFQLARLLMPQQVTIDKIKNLTQEVFEGLIPYASLWGAIKLKLLSRLDEFTEFKDDDLLFGLASLDDINVRAILIDVLVTVAGESNNRRIQVVELCNKLLKTNSLVTGSIAIEIAHRLSATQILQSGMLSPNRAIWQMATQYTFFLWQKDAKAGRESFVALRDTLRKQLTVNGVPSLLLRALRKKGGVLGLSAYLNLALLSISLANHNPEIASVAGESLRDWVDSLPIVLKQGLNKMLTVTKSGQKVILEILGNGPIVQLRSFRPFIQRSIEDPQRKQCSELISFIDHNNGSLNGELGDLLFDLASEMDAWTYLCCSVVLMTRLGNQFEDLFRFCTRLYTKGNLHAQYVAIRIFPLATYMELSGAYCEQKHIDFAQNIILDFVSGTPKQIEYEWQEEANGPVTKKRSPLAHLSVGFALELASRQSGPLDFVDKVKSLPWNLTEEQRTIAIFEQLHRATLLSTATRKFAISPVLESLSGWFGNEGLTEGERLSLVRAIAGIRSYYPLDADLYLREAPSWLRVSVLNEFQLDPIGWVLNIGSQVGQPWLIRQVPEIRQLIVNALESVSLKVTNEIQLEEVAYELGTKYVNIQMIRELTNALAEAKIDE